MLKYFYYYGLAVFLSIGCNNSRPLYTKTAMDNPTYKVSFLFEHDGCKVYRFYDCGQYVYFTSCNGETSYMPDSAHVIKNTTKKFRKK
jgi:hypothetical protein